MEKSLKMKIGQTKLKALKTKIDESLRIKHIICPKFLIQ